MMNKLYTFLRFLPFILANITIIVGGSFVGYAIQPSASGLVGGFCAGLLIAMFLSYLLIYAALE